MRNYLIIAIAIAVSGFAIACPSGQREECIVPTPWGCRQMICIPDVMIDIPSLNKDQTRDLAVQAKSEATATDVNCLNQNSFAN